MINTVALSFTADFQSEIEPAYLIVGACIGMVAVVAVIKKIIGRRNKK